MKKSDKVVAWNFTQDILEYVESVSGGLKIQNLLPGPKLSAMLWIPRWAPKNIGQAMPQIYSWYLYITSMIVIVDVKISITSLAPPKESWLEMN